MKLDAVIIVPTIVIMATLIVGWILAWGDIRELRKENAKLENDFWQEHDLVVALTDEIYWREIRNPTAKEEVSNMKRLKKRTEEATAGPGPSSQQSQS